MKFKNYINEVKKLLEPIFDVNDAPNFVHELEKKIKVPYIKAQMSTLGGPENVSVLMRLSLDPQETWENGIMENSRMMHFRFDRNGTVEQFSKSYTISKKFRKATAKNTKDAIDKVNKYISQVK